MTTSSLQPYLHDSHICFFLVRKDHETYNLMNNSRCEGQAKDWILVVAKLGFSEWFPLKRVVLDAQPAKIRSPLGTVILSTFNFFDQERLTFKGIKKIDLSGLLINPFLFFPYQSHTTQLLRNVYFFIATIS